VLLQRRYRINPSRCISFHCSCSIFVCPSPAYRGTQAAQSCIAATWSNQSAHDLRTEMEFLRRRMIDYDFDDESDSHSKKHSYTKLQQALERTIGEITKRGRNILIIGSQAEPPRQTN
jgi:hypothetical protein